MAGTSILYFFLGEYLKVILCDKMFGVKVYNFEAFLLGGSYVAYQNWPVFSRNEDSFLFY